MVTWWHRRRRVVMHLIDPHPNVTLPRVEGILWRRPRAWRREYLIAVPLLTFAAGAEAVMPEKARYLAIPVQNVAFYEVLA